MKKNSRKCVVIIVSKEIFLERIQTDTAAENFARQLNESKENYFINGRWGTGKTEFLNNVRKKSKKKFVNLNLWDMKDNRNVVSIAYSKLHPIIYWGTNIVAIFMIAMSILFSSWYVSEIKNVFIGRYNEVNFLQLIGAFLVLFFSVWKTMGVKKENFYFWSMKFLLNENKVLFIDDFDRVDSKVREEAYKLFNILNGVIPIIILGDIDKITEEKTLAFLQKIIDTRVELPFALYTETIWDKYFDKLKETFGDVDLNNLKKIFIKEKRNLRDREQFNKMVNREFFKRGKYKHVQVDQQLLVIYTYIFHPDIYAKLLANEKIPVSEEYSKVLNTDTSIEFFVEKDIRDLIYDICNKYSDKYPRTFSQDRENYYIYEVVSNATNEELLNVVESKSELIKNLKLIEKNDFNQYLLVKSIILCKILYNVLPVSH